MAIIQKINIDQQIAQLGIRHTPARMNIKSQRMQMKIKNEHAQMEIERKAPSFRVNRKKLNSDMGVAGPVEFTAQFSEQGKAGALRGARTAVDDGNFLGEMRRKGDRVGPLARKKAMTAIMKNKEINLGLTPKNRPEVVWDKGSMTINWSRHSILIDWDGEYMPQLTVDPKYSVEIFLRTEPYFRVSVSEMIDPGTPGRYVDKEI